MYIAGAAPEATLRLTHLSTPETKKVSAQISSAECSTRANAEFSLGKGQLRRGIFKFAPNVGDAFFTSSNIWRTHNKLLWVPPGGSKAGGWVAREWRGGEGCMFMYLCTDMNIYIYIYYIYIYIYVHICIS